MKEGKVLPLRRGPQAGGVEREGDPGPGAPLHPGPSVSDESLVAACGAGDLAALGALFDRHHRPLYGFLSRLAGTDERDLDDLVQATFLEVVGAAKNYRRQAAVRTWLFGIAARVVSRHVRSDVRRRALHLRAAEQAREDGPDATADAERRDLMARIGAVLAQLPHDLRAAFVMCVVEEIPGGEAARALGVREGTLWWRLHEARKALRAALERIGP
jgi:RNA polymerase sigma-70 factor (ECF subfamily)